MANSTLTKRAIAKSYRKILETTPTDRVTVSAIAAECGINRQTFYYHFSDIYDLIDWIILDDVDAILSNNGNDWKRSMVELLGSMRKDRALILRLARTADPAITYRRLLKGSVTSLVRRSIGTSCRETGLTDEECQLAADFYAAGLIEVSLSWLEDDGREGPEELVGRLEAVMRSGITEALSEL